MGRLNEEGGGPLMGGERCLYNGDDGRCMGEKCLLGGELGRLGGDNSGRLGENLFLYFILSISFHRFRSNDLLSRSQLS